MKKTLALLLLLAGLSVEAQGKTLYWNGNKSDKIWDKVSQNWLDSYGQAESYKDGDWVSFYDSGDELVILPELLEPSLVEVDNSVGHDYTFVSTGGLIGKMMLIKYGEGKLTIQTSNDYTGDTMISKGTIVVGDKMALGRSRIVMSNYSGGLPTLDLGKYSISNSVFVEHGYASIGNGTLSGDLTLEKKSHLTLLDDTDITGNISLGDGATFNLADNSVTGAVTLAGSATIGNGTINGDMAVAEGKSLVLLEHTTVTGGVSLGAQSSLNLGGNTFHTGGEGGSQVTFSGDATVSNGTLVLDSDWSPGYALTFTDITLDLNKHTLTGRVTTHQGNNNIGNGTIAGNVIVNRGSRIHLYGETHFKGGTMTFENDPTTVKALDPATPGLLKELTVSKGLIAGTDRQTSLADGLNISRMGDDLTLENLVLTANNSISVGDGRTITLNNVTIKLSRYTYDGPEGIFSFDLKSLINCDLVMENVLLDASDLTLPEGFDPANKSVVFDFGDDVTIKQATGLDMRLGNYWSPSIPLDEQGKIIFKNLVETPEPATGTLSLLALAALAARRRKK